MNNTPSLNERNKTANMNPNLLTRHFKLKLMNDFMYIKYQNPKLKQSETANQLNLSSSTLQRYRNDIKMLPPYRIQPNNTNKRTEMTLYTIFDNNSYHEPDVKRPQMTSNKKNKSILKTGSVQENIDLNEHYLDEIFG